MDRKVAIIPTVKSVDPPDTVILLQELLEQARSGEITEVVAITVSEDGQAVYNCAGVNDAFRLLGLMKYAMHCLLNVFEGEE
jgi:hypothetical protein